MSKGLPKNVSDCHDMIDDLQDEVTRLKSERDSYEEALLDTKADLLQIQGQLSQKTEDNNRQSESIKVYMTKIKELDTKYKDTDEFGKNVSKLLADRNSTIRELGRDIDRYKKFIDLLLVELDKKKDQV